MGRRRISGLLAGLALLAACGRESEAPPGPGSAPPSFLLILADDLGPDLGSYGEALARTPVLDALAESGMRFDAAFAAAPVCSPSRASILTGLLPHENGQVGFPGQAHLRSGALTVAEQLAARGYATGVIGKLHVAPNRESPQLGFQHFETTGRAGEHSAQDLGRATAAFLAGAGAKPFFLQVGLHEPHTPYPGSDGRPPVAEPTDPSLLPPLPGAPELPLLRRFRAAYLDAVSRVDPQVAAVLSALRLSGRDADTAVILSSDHGPPLPGGKSTLFDAGLRVPLIVRWPGLTRPGSHSGELVSLLDLAPTLLEAAGAAPEPRLQGRSLMPLLRGGKGPGARAILAENTYLQGGRYFPQRLLRTARFAYLRNLRPDLQAASNGFVHWAGPWLALYDRDEAARTLLDRLVRHPAEELYDLAEDPAELRNRARDPALAETLAALRAELRSALARSGDPWLELWERPAGAPDRFEPHRTRDGAFEAHWLDAALESLRRGQAPALPAGDD